MFGYLDLQKMILCNQQHHAALVADSLPKGSKIKF